MMRLATHLALSDSCRPLSIVGVVFCVEPQTPVASKVLLVVLRVFRFAQLAIALLLFTVLVSACLRLVFGVARFPHR
jgi:hypothetical protein